ncbi:MAG: hypothetical protein JXA46_15925 [Dehalococcoidales bacterium]|nr:hypothetical protein [Dehalococcoidales bacterium]
MDAVFKTSLFVNNVRIDLNEFAHNYVTRIVLCAVSMLKGGSDVRTLLFTLENEKTGLVINDLTVPLSPYPRDALRGTFSGMASSLRGVDKIDSLRIEINLK